MLSNLQVLRGIAALMVVFEHWAILHHGWLGHLGLFGSGGVDIFFVLSGFVMSYTTSAKPVSGRTFIVNRIVRVLPLYWSVTIAWFVLARLRPSLFPSSHFDLATLLSSLLFIPKAPHPVVPVGWTLNYEMFFYACFAASLSIRRTPRREVIVVLGLLGIVLSQILWTSPGAGLEFYRSPLLLEFCFGILLAVMFRNKPSWFVSRGSAFALAICSAVLLIAMQSQLWLPRFIALGVPASMLVFSALSLELEQVTVKSTVLLLLGSASYAIYLVHMPLVVALFKVASRFELGSGVRLPISAVVTITLATLGGIVTHLLLERPVDHWLRRALRREAGRRSDIEPWWSLRR